MEQMKNLELIILVGKYAQEYYLKDNPYKNLVLLNKNRFCKFV